MSDYGQQPVIGTQPGWAGDQDHFRQALYYPSEEVNVRAMNASDCDFVGSLVIEAFRGMFVHNIGTRNLPLAKEAHAEDLRISPHKYPRVLVAEIGGRRAGIVELGFRGDRSGNSSDRWNRMGCCSLCRLGIFSCCLNEKVPRGHCSVECICVDEGFRGKGIGKALLAAADQQARANNCRTIFLWVASDNRALNLYTREGYQVTTTTTGWCGTLGCITGINSFKKMEKSL